MAKLIDYLIENLSYNPPTDYYSNSTHLINSNWAQENPLQLGSSPALDVDKEGLPVLLPVINAVVGGGINFAVNIALEKGFEPKNRDFNFQYGWVVGLRFQVHSSDQWYRGTTEYCYKNLLLNNFEIDTAQAQAIASTATSSALVGTVAVGSVLGAFSNDVRTLWKGVDKSLPYLSGKLPQAMSVTGAYALQSALKVPVSVMFQTSMKMRMKRGSSVRLQLQEHFGG